MASVTLDRINRIYGPGAHAVRDVSLEIADGEFMVLVGPSGCGKSTTLRMVAGLEPIDRGALYIGEREVSRLEPAERDIAMVFQNYALYPHMTVAQNMGFGLRVRGVARAERDTRVRAAAAVLGLEPLLDRKPGAMSGGQRQRVAIGRAIVRDPAVFLFDEPLSNLDAKLRAEMRTELAALHRRLAATMLYVTHDQVEAMTLGDRICLLRDGCVQQVGTPVELYDTPANAFVARFIGSPPMNVFAGVVRSDGGFSGEGLALLLPVTLPQNASVEVGLRPEQLELVPAGQAGEPTAGNGLFAARVALVERMGSHSLVHLRTGSEAAGTALIVRAAGDTPAAEGDAVGVRYRVGDVRVFREQGTG